MGTNGRGKVGGGQPGTPIKPPFKRIDGCSIGRSYVPTTPNAVRYKDWVLRILLEIDSGLKDYNRRRRTNANAPKPMARSESAEGSGTDDAILKPIPPSA